MFLLVCLQPLILALLPCARRLQCRREHIIRCLELCHILTAKTRKFNTTDKRLVSVFHMWVSMYVCRYVCLLESVSFLSVCLDLSLFVSVCLFSLI